MPFEGPDGLATGVLAVYSVRLDFLAARSTECQDVTSDEVNGQHRRCASAISSVGRLLCAGAGEEYSRATAASTDLAGDPFHLTLDTLARWTTKFSHPTGEGITFENDP